MSAENLKVRRAGWSEHFLNICDELLVAAGGGRLIEVQRQVMRMVSARDILWMPRRRCGCGEIGIRGGLKIHWGFPRCRFESDQPHHFQKRVHNDSNSYVITNVRRITRLRLIVHRSPWCSADAATCRLGCRLKIRTPLQSL